MGTITHTHQTALANDPTKDVSATHWNAGHTFSLDKTDVGLASVDNTSDAAKPVSTATQTALDAKQPLDADLTALAALITTGMMARTAANTYVMRTIAGTLNRVSVTDGDGVLGAPTIDIAATYVGQTSITTLGTIGTGVWNGTVIAAAKVDLSAYSTTAAIAAAYQPLDADLTALAALATTGIMARTAANTYTMRTLTAPAAGISVSNGDGVAGNPTLALANDLSALEGLASTGLAARTAADTWAQRTITGTANQVTVSNGDGVAGNPTLSIPASPAFTGTTTAGDAVITGTGNVNAQTGTTYTLASSDNGKLVTCSNAAAITVSLNTGLTAGFWCTIVQLGAGQVTVGGTGTSNSANGKKTRAQYSMLTIAYAGTTDNYFIGGDTAV